MRMNQFIHFNYHITHIMKPGTYIYEVIEGDQKIHSGKIVIQ